MAMKNPRLTVFVGAVAALAVMTALSAAMGWAAPNLVRAIREGLHQRDSLTHNATRDAATVLGLSMHAFQGEFLNCPADLQSVHTLCSNVAVLLLWTAFII